MLFRWNGLADGSEMEHKYLRQTKLFKQLVVPLRGNLVLHPWQRLGVTFLDFCARKYGFAILADEMGLGKVHSP
jgi:SNF2 family DNA or RNA helicase